MLYFALSLLLLTAMSVLNVSLHRQGFALPKKGLFRLALYCFVIIGSAGLAWGLGNRDFAVVVMLLPLYVISIDTLLSQLAQRRRSKRNCGDAHSHEGVTH